MARVPEYTRRVFLNRSRPSNIAAASAAGGGNEARGLLQEANQSLQNAARAGALAEQRQREQKAESQVLAQEQFNKERRELAKLFEDQRNERMTNPTNFADDFDEVLNKRLGEIEQRENDPDNAQGFDLDYFRAAYDKYRTSVYEKNQNWESGMRNRNTVVTLEKNIEDMNNTFVLSNPTYSDYVSHLDEIRTYAGTAGSKVLAPDQVMKFTEYGIDQATQAFIDRELQENPRQLKAVLKYGQGGKDNIVDMVAGELERVRTNAQKEEIANKWDSRLEEFDPTFQAIALDAIVSHGAKDAWEMIEKSKGDPYNLIVAREQKYAEKGLNPDELTKTNQRMDQLVNFVETMEGGGSDFLEHTGLIDPNILAKTLGSLDSSIASKKRQEEKALFEAQEADAITQINNQNTLLEDIEGDDLTYDEKMLNINKQELTKQITQEFAADARRYLESKKSIDAITNADKMSDIVRRMYDLNTIADMNEKDYLRGVQNIKREIMALRAGGELNRDDELKLSNQLKTLTSSKVAEATETLAFSFGEANNIIETSLPPEYRGEATRNLFYKVDEEIKQRPGLSGQEERALYSKHARTIVDKINIERRERALKTVTDPVKIYERPEVKKMLETKGYTQRDVKETAKKYGITEKQVIDRMMQ